jgi:putative pyoverdin transport system ATP-binding/permease protein
MITVLRFYLSSSTGHRSTAFLIAAIAMILLGGIANIALLAIVTQMVSRNAGFGWNFVLALIALGGFLGITRGVAQYLLTKVTIDSLVALRMGLCSQIIAAPLSTLERLGNARLTATFTESMPAISNALVQLPNIVLYAIVAGGSIVYMAWLSWKALIVILLAGGAIIALYRYVNGRAQKEFMTAFGYYRQVLKGFNELVNGAKELKLHRARRKAHLASALSSPMSGLASHRLTSSFLYGTAEAWSTAGMFFTIALVLTITRTASKDVGAGFVLALLYLMPLVQGILTALPAFSQAESAIVNFQALTTEVAAQSDVALTHPAPSNNWREIWLKDIEFGYQQEGDSSFRVGPLNFCLQQGETVFVTGGNGSGKTTLIKLLLGLYRPHAGEILVDGVPVSDQYVDDYRQRFSAVFFDFHLFDRLHGLPGIDEEAAAYLRHLRLDHKVKVENGELSTINLSQGQKKRLALLTAYLEDRPIYIFDEWAADQDFEFREFFYYEIVPGLKRRNKTVIVITHDDRYFHLADRLVKLDFGRIVETSQEDFYAAQTEAGA